MSSPNQWVVTVVTEGEYCPFDYVEEFMENLRVRGDYDVISFAVTPVSGIQSSSGSSTDTDYYLSTGLHHNYGGASDDADDDTDPARIDSHRPNFYAGRGYSE